ncbi:hypothetical protein [Denitromonas ohlonensis]|uniref:Uncharacterized protein n=2 Tax=Denitromonas TaxID=139331 RepID=A0A557RDS0_9RHOO|nr:hypothetical protein [Denitromonas ohlonensis]TVT47609.1 MAG: hypothetical protein FHP94_13660 [Denitromonas halophila]TVO63312.1 hypothetical protein FHP90_14890 [Denitromonas ohlonensis]TVO76141.1 hypothetical protein FHP89_11855 [Denitromonas ohlonensis]TVT70042.1 MAG: hypothetical protein FHP93_12665 [Denitromonas halophila]TVT77528.1 MAG: hypothetical protein FHP92_05035 [Denitromonas halophila]
MQSKPCAGCGKLFHPRPQTPGQTYCASSACQRERRRRWQQARRQTDPDYRENQARAQAAWAAQHPDYWREYQRLHPAYRERNRCLQPARDARRAQRVLAKMDVWTRETSVPSGLYRLSPATRDDLAKMDAWMVRITTVSRPCAPSG